MFLDEPTTGLDPRSRIGLWDVIEELVDGGTTVLLTTQYPEDADRLANRIVVIDHGGSSRKGPLTGSSATYAATSSSCGPATTRASMQPA